MTRAEVAEAERGSTATRLTEALERVRGDVQVLATDSRETSRAMGATYIIQRIDAALAAARADAPQDPNEEDGQIWGPT